MKTSAAGRAAVWTAAVSTSAVAPRAALVAISIAVAREAFDLVRARSDRLSVLTFIRAAGAGTYLSVDRAGAGPGLVLHAAAATPAGQFGDPEGTRRVPDNGHLPRPADALDPGAFCIEQRADWLGYARSLTKNWADAEDAVQRAAEKILQHHAEHGTLCPAGRDPIGYAKRVIANYLIDGHRRFKAQRKRSRVLTPTAGDIADEVLDQMCAKDALIFVASLKPREHQIAILRWGEGLEPKEIAARLGLNDRTVRTSLHRTTKKMRAHLGVVTKPETILRGEAT